MNKGDTGARCYEVKWNTMGRGAGDHCSGREQPKQNVPLYPSVCKYIIKIRQFRSTTAPD